MDLKQFIPPIFIPYLKKLRSSLITTYTIGKYSLKIPPQYALPNYQRVYRLYDRFLPVLAKHINGDQTIIDIGANIGDTAIAILQNCNNPIICIEPSDHFYRYLENNINSLDIKDLHRVKLLKKMIGTGSIFGNLSHTERGTASIRIENSVLAQTHDSLDSIMEKSVNIILLKVDTDGYDHDVIRSADKLIDNMEPILFWENEVSTEFQYRNYDEMYTWLENKGYKYVYIFDNYGNLLTEEIGFNTLRHINTYLFSMVNHKTTRTFFYTDILATTEKYHTEAFNAIKEYKQNWINI